MPFHIVKQHDIKDCGAACLSMILRHFQLKLPMAKCRELIQVDSNGASIYGLVRGADAVGLKAAGLEGSANELIEGVKKRELTLPLIARVIIDEMLEHYVVVYKMTNRFIYVADPGSGKKKYKYDEFFRLWTGHVVTFEKTDDFKEGNECRGTLSRFIRLLTRQKKLLSVICLCSLFISLIGVAGAFVFQIILSGIEALHENGYGSFSPWRLCSAVIVLYLFQALINILRGYCLAHLSKKIDLSLMLGYYNHITDLPIKHLNNRKTGELLSRFNDAAAIKEAISGAALSLVLDTLMILICIFILYALNPLLFAITLCIIVTYAIVVICFIKPTQAANEKIMEQNAEVTSYIKESLDGIETVKSFGSEAIIKKKTEERFLKLLKHSVKGSVIYTIQDSLSGFVASVGVIVLLGFGSCLVSEHIISLGTLITFYSLLGYFLDPIQRLIDLQPQLQTAIVAADRLNDLLDLDIEENTHEKTPLHNAIEIENLSFRYGNREPVLQNITLNIRPGETVAFVGESGSGKTTLANLIMAFYPPESGKIIIGGKDISTLNPRAVRENIAYIAQDVFLFSDSVWNNLTMGNQSLSEADVKRACQLSMADEFIQKLPMGYHTLLGENGHDLSGGQKQRLAIARALLKKPKILIMDEATSNLDSITENSIKKAINTLEGEITCIIIAHRLSTIQNCNKIYVMERGSIVEAGTHAELMCREGLYYRYHKAM